MTVIIFDGSLDRGSISLVKKVIYSRREARIDLCDFLLQNTTEFF